MLLPRISKRARTRLDAMLSDHNHDLFALLEEYGNEGLCLVCGSTQNHVEPDAQAYECENCGEHSVMGLTTVLLTYL